MAVEPRFGYFAIFGKFSTTNAQKEPYSTFGQIYPKIPISCFLFDYVRILVALSPMLYISVCVLSENGFCNATNSEFRGYWGKKIDNPKKLSQRNIHTTFRVERAIKRSVPFAGVDLLCEETSHSTLRESHRKMTSA